MAKIMPPRLLPSSMLLEPHNMTADQHNASVGTKMSIYFVQDPMTGKSFGPFSLIPTLIH